jgi:hypothetical protein
MFNILSAEVRPYRDFFFRDKKRKKEKKKKRKLLELNQISLARRHYEYVKNLTV